MKNLLFVLFSFSSFAFSTPFDFLLQQRNIADTATLTRTAPLQAPNVVNIMATDEFTNFPRMITLGQPFGVFNNQLEVSLRWDQILNKPDFALVAMSGDYNDLSNKPSGIGQVNSDWAATTGVEAILNKPTFAAVATSGSYTDLSNQPTIPPAQVNSDWTSNSGVSYIMNKPSTIAGYGITDAYPLSGNPSGFLTGITGAQVSTALGFSPYSSANPSGYVSQSGARSAITLTTTGTSGAASYNSATGVLNVPNYAPGTGTVTSITAGAGLSGGTITTSGTISLPNTGTAGTYNTVTTDAQGRVSSGTVLSINDAPGRALVTATTSTGYQISATRNARVCYEGSFSTTSSIGGPSSASVFLETADTNSTTAADWTTKAHQTYSNNITLAVVLNQVQGNNWSFCRDIPAGKFVRLRVGSITGTASATINTDQQEVLQ